MTHSVSVVTLADPLYGHGPNAGELVITYVELLNALALLIDPLKGKDLEPSKNPSRDSSRPVDRRSVWASRRLDYELEDIGEAIANLTIFVEAPKPVPMRNRHRLTKCPDCRKHLEEWWNVCPRCTYDLRRNAGRGPRCALASCPKSGRPRRHGAQYCDACGTPLLGGPG